MNIAPNSCKNSARLFNKIDPNCWMVPPAEASEESREASKRDPPPVINLAVPDSINLLLSEASKR